MLRNRCIIRKVLVYNDLPRFKQPFYEAFVFVIGGGSYVEYQNLLDWTRESSGGSATTVSTASGTNLSGMTGSTNASGGPGSTDPSAALSSSSSSLAGSISSGVGARRVTYGCTEVVSPSEFLDQVSSGSGHRTFYHFCLLRIYCLVDCFTMDAV
ncbi:unnamed protein product [Echinostoma caproni]|uniref:Protein-serine/threonine phosphatase n=1 Tax=Echinostoma caproni TaxID=27848 RepID=A0A183A2M8_9TREM|nr:unnamed protein product [Echinostoma caproni]